MGRVKVAQFRALALSLGWLEPNAPLPDVPTLAQSLATKPKHTAAAFGLLAAAVKQSGRSLRPRFNDLWIAAQAIEHGYTLLTLNTSDFADLPGLRVATLSPKSQA